MAKGFPSVTYGTYCLRLIVDALVVLREVGVNEYYFNKHTHTHTHNSKQMKNSTEREILEIEVKQNFYKAFSRMYILYYTYNEKCGFYDSEKLSIKLSKKPRS